MPARNDIRVAALLTSQAGRQVPTVAIEHQPPTTTAPTSRSQHGSTLLSTLVAYGMTTEVNLHQTARPLLNWPVSIGPSGPMRARIRIVLPGNLAPIDGVTAYTPLWRTAATRTGWLLLYAGYQLWDPTEAAPTSASIAAAWRAGTLAAARLQIRRPRC
ncbi:hypothetical protein ACWT_5795 [Actinoplanes sp. SE50]|nr:hypothetical protein ACPL_5926 [Actinoplanes sp. SE50/110]ATO85210.1 hypothetical protein ACWT_5795 [Actinoplanes sp. SE50]SLM02620.1 hypothetical protein ACSP50_5902 [Actinoplanes sp. SE50/110]